MSPPKTPRVPPRKDAASLADYPALVAQLDRRLNGRIAPESITRASSRRLWWRCTKGPDHVWQAPVSRRSAGHGCPFCRSLALSVTNALSTVAPELAKQWHPTKNGGLRPCDVVAGTTRIVWWKCPNDPTHEWQRAVVARLGGRGCPLCVGRQSTQPHRRVLAKEAPRLAAEWHPTKNGSLTPYDVRASSGRRVWWKCPKAPDHEWDAPVYVRLTSGCPFCANMRVCSTNSLAAVNPELARDWHPTKNGKLTPCDVVPWTPRRVWWKCLKGPDHEWQSAVANRLRGTACPFCVNRLLSVTNSLAATYPKVAAEWHPTKNRKVTPRDIVPGTAKRFWWRCVFGHEWQASAANRTIRGSNCPECWRLRRKQQVVTKGKRGRPVHLAAYEGPHHGPVRHVK